MTDDKNSRPAQTPSRGDSERLERASEPAFDSATSDTQADNTRRASQGPLPASEQPTSLGEPTMPERKDHRLEDPVIDRYRLLQQVGEGGMGEVWEAEQHEPVRRRVAIKVIKRGMDTKLVVARFEAERQALALMNHPNVAKVFDAGQTPRGRPYFVMELVKGDPITVYCDKNRLTTRQRLELLIQVCDGVQHAHQKGVIHRDLKPSNILVTIEGGDRPTPKIIDFGVAKATNQHLTERTLFTELGQLIGTPEYMSPEQAEMTGIDIDTRTDVYSIGVVLYELLAGTLPFDSKELRQASLVEIQRRIREEEPPRPSTRVSSLAGSSQAIAERRQTDVSVLARRLKGDLDWITMKALDKDRTRRYASPNDLANDLRRHLNNEPVLAASPSVSYRVRKFVRRHKLGVATAGALVIMLLLGVAGTAAGLMRAREAESQAIAARDEALAEKDRAEQARDEVEEVVDFMVELFKVSSPMESGPTGSERVELSARVVLDGGEARIDSELADRPLTRARLLDTLGTVYQSLGLNDIAQDQKEEALAIRQRELGDRHAQTAAAIDSLASLATSQAEYELGEELSRQSLSIYREIHGDEHPDIAGALAGIGRARSGIGDREGALSNYREALDMARRLGDRVRDDDLELYVRRMATALDSLGRSEEAEPLYLESLELCREIYGAEHPKVAFALDNLAILYDYRGEPDRAEPLYRESLAMLQKVYGEKHPEIAQTMGNLGNFLIHTARTDRGIDSRRLNEAARLQRGALDMNRGFRPDHPFLADNITSLGDIEQLRGNHRLAEERYLEGLEIYRLKLDEANSKITSNKKALSDSLVSLGRTAEAEALLLENLRALEAVGNRADEIDDAVSDLVDFYEKVGRPDDAAQIASNRGL